MTIYGSDPGFFRGDGPEPEHGAAVVGWFFAGLVGLALAGLLWRGCAAPRFRVPAEAGRTQQEAGR